MINTVKRAYSCQDEALLKRASVMLMHMQDNLALFTAKFPFLDAAYATQLELDIKTANEFPDDHVGQGSKKILTEDVQTAMTESDGALRNLGIYARLAYPTDPERRYVFGQKTWAAARSNRKKMFDALTLAYSFVTQEPYKTDLGDKGFTVANANQLRDNALLVEERKIPQGKAGKERKIGTADRIKLYHIVWKKMKTLKNCAQLVFRNSAAHRDLFLLYERRKKKEEV